MGFKASREEPPPQPAKPQQAAPKTLEMEPALARMLLRGCMRRWIWTALIIILSRTMLADARPRTAEPVEFPMEFREGLIWVAVAVADRPQPLWFLLDSGASASVLDLETARRLRLPLGDRVRVAGVASTRTGFWPVKLSARLGDFALPTDYLALDLGRLSQACDRPVDGLLGADFFRDRVIEVDYQAQRLRVLSSDSSRLEGPGDSIPLESGPYGFRVGVRVNGGDSQPVRVDTGCATALQWVRPGDKTRHGEPTRAVGLAELSVRQTLTGVRLGTRVFDTVPTGLHAEPIFPGESGLLGNGLLAQFGTVTFDTAAGRLHFGRRESR